MLPGRPGRGCWRRAATATPPAVSVRQTGLLCRLLLPRHRLGCSRAPSLRNCWKLCACRRWLRAAPPFLRAVSAEFARASLLARSGVSLRSAQSKTPVVCGHSRPPVCSWEFCGCLSVLIGHHSLWEQPVHPGTITRAPHPDHRACLAAVNSLHDWTPVERGGLHSGGVAYEALSASDRSTALKRRAYRCFDQSENSAG